MHPQRPSKYHKNQLPCDCCNLVFCLTTIWKRVINSMMPSIQQQIQILPHSCKNFFWSGSSSESQWDLGISSLETSIQSNPNTGKGTPQQCLPQYKHQQLCVYHNYKCQRLTHNPFSQTTTNQIVVPILQPWERELVAYLKVKRSSSSPSKWEPHLSMTKRPLFSALKQH